MVHQMRLPRLTGKALSKFFNHCINPNADERRSSAVKLTKKYSFSRMVAIAIMIRCPPIWWIEESNYRECVSPTQVMAPIQLKING
ncbi:MAG TPA: hypothetical protein ACFE0H_11555 [Elainellaceae cyanobacterium]